ncbi:MAG: glycosyltransferase [Flavobacteriales bacterium]
MQLWDHYQARYQVHLDISGIDIPQSLSFCIVIPSFNEPTLEDLLRSLAQIHQPECDFAVIVVLNHALNTTETVKNHHTNQQLKLEKLKSSLPYELIVLNAYDIPDVKAGVGYARKLGMDYAAYQLIKQNQPKGLIVCLDADCQVSDNYLISLADVALQSPNSVSMALAHPFETLSEKHRSGIVHYELFLRYYLLALKFTGFPYCAYTIGSAMGVSAQLYVKSGGMNQRKAGEDFYFMNKLLPHGRHIFISDTQVFPSPRISERVPFGTGRSMKMWLEQNKDPGQTYSVWCFQQIKHVIDCFAENAYLPKQFPKAPLVPILRNYLIKRGAETIIEQLKTQAKDVSARKKRFFQWFDAFLIMKCLNLLITQAEGSASVIDCLKEMLPDFPDTTKEEAEMILLWLREKEKGAN